MGERDGTPSCKTRKGVPMCASIIAVASFWSSVSVAPKWADGAWRRVASGRGCSEGRRGVCLQEWLERDSLEVPRTEVRGIGGNRRILGTGQSESMVRWHEQARLRRALSSMWNPGFGALPLAALGGAALGGKVTGVRPRRIGPGSGRAEGERRGRSDGFLPGIGGSSLPAPPSGEPHSRDG